MKQLSTSIKYQPFLYLFFGEGLILLPKCREEEGLTDELFHWKID